MQAYRLLLNVALVCASCTASVAHAQGAFGGLVDLTSDYVYHGLSESNGDPALQADLHYRSDSGAASAQTFIGLWGSTIKRAASGGAYELNAYLGRSFLIRSSSATLTYVHYAYPDDHGYPRYDYDELSAGWAYQDRVFATIAWTPDTARYSERALGRCCRVLSYSIAVHQSLPHAFTLTGAVGYDEIHGAAGYAYGNLGIAYALGPWQFDLSYFAMQPRAAHLYGSIGGDRLVGTLAWRF